MSHAPHEIARQVDDLQARYVRALDTRDLRGWLDTFRREPDTAYFCISAENVERDLPIALMYDDCRDRIEDRVVFIEKIWAGTFQDYRTRHFIQRLHVTSDPAGVVRVETNFSILFTPETGRTEVQVAGLYRDEIVIDDDGARFRSKRAIYDTTILPRYIVYPF
ncbi:MAG TPA: aromatic-ring-hydroxylating dioxygenase subunit beta [Nevskiaceae bacterium]|nr:aromatic-ring-hydroxylating dioxygenase subunit beta [Nevskiaceae bacterium]